MKTKLFALSFLLAGSLICADTDFNSNYQEALDAYQENNFALGYEKFSQLYMTNLSDVKLNFYLGRCAYETGHYEMALAAFERVEMLEPSNLRNRLEMGRTYYMLKMYEDAENSFKEVLQNPNIPQNVRTNIELYLSKVTKVQEKSFTYATINLDWIYDSNVNYASLENEYSTALGKLPSEEELSDRALQVYADITNVYDIGEKNGFAIKNRASLFIKDYLQEDAYNIHFLSYMPSLLYSQTHYLVELGGGMDSLSIATKHYLQTYSLISKLEYAHTPTLKSIGILKYQKKNFQQTSEKDLDANHYELSYALQQILSPRSYVQWTLTGISEKKIEGKRIDVDYTEYKASVAYANQFTTTYATNFLAEYRIRDYSDASSLFDSTRSDNAANFIAEVNALIMPSLRAHVKGVYNRVESNQEKFSYEKYTLSLGLSKTF